MNKRIINLLVEYRELMRIRRGLPSGESRKKVKKQLKEIYVELVDVHWKEIPESIKTRLGLKPRKLNEKSERPTQP